MEARKRARKYGVPFNLIADDVLIPKICPVLGIPIVLGNGKPTDHSPTVDRVVPKLGYIKSNIRVISYKANRIKSNATSSEVRRILEYMQAPDPSFHSLISEDYRKQQEALHAVGDYGTVGGQYAVVVAQIIERLNVTHLLDYGCGSNCSLSKALKVPHKLTYQAYDPGV
ncbi:MAG: hypothetical protein ACREQ5_09650, partial [Candidatus Dormibacteria bacterium]